MAEKRIVIEFKDKGRAPAVTEYMPAEEADQEFARIAHLLGRSGTEGDQWITVGKTVVIGAQEVHNVTLADQVLPAFYFGDDEDSISNRQFYGGDLPSGGYLSAWPRDLGCGP